MAYSRPPEYSDSSNRLPWIVLGIGLLVIIGAAAGYIWLNRTGSGQNVNITVASEPTPTRPSGSPVAGLPPTPAPPTAQVSATATPQPTPTPVPVASPLPGATFAPAPGQATPPPAAASPTQPPAAAPPAPTAPGAQAAPTQPAPGAGGAPAPAQPSASTPTAAPPQQQPTPAAKPQASPSPTPFSGQVSAAGGLANTLEDLQAAYGPPAGETPGKLVVFRKGNVEYHVDLSPDRQRAILIAEQPPQNAPLAMDAAVQESRKLFPRDTQPRSNAPEGNNQFVIERFTSPTLAQALPAELWDPQRKGQPGDFLVIYLKNQQGAITRIVVGIGDDPTVLLDRSGQ